SYSPYDTSWFYMSALPQDTENWCGALGAQVAALCVFLFGGSAVFLSCLLLWCGILALLHSVIVYEWERVAAGAALV
ncbi:DNA translocase FtsK 4TM domain-containing protein, partial [Lactobacillus alvi]